MSRAPHLVVELTATEARELLSTLGETHPLAPRLAEVLAVASRKGLSFKTFLAIVEPLLPTLSLPPKPMRTPAWYGMMGKLLRQSGLTTETAEELARTVAAWSTQAMPVRTLVTRAAEYLSKPTHNKAGKAGPSPLGAMPIPRETSDDE